MTANNNMKSNACFKVSPVVGLAGLLPWGLELLKGWV